MHMMQLSADTALCPVPQSKAKVCKLATAVCCLFSEQIGPQDRPSGTLSAADACHCGVLPGLFLAVNTRKSHKHSKEKCQGSLMKKKSQCVILRNVVLLFFRRYIKERTKNTQKYIIPKSMQIIFA